MPTKEDLFAGFTIGEWEVLPGRGMLRRGEQEERPEPKVFAVLIALATRDGNLVTRDELVDEVWDGRPTTDEPINRCLSQLRGHLDDRHRPHEYVETLQRRGYRLMKPVALHEQPQAEQAEAPQEPGPSLRSWKIVATVMALGFLGTIAVTMGPPAPKPEVRSIAVLPIDNLSGDPANQYIVDGIKNTLAQRLAEIPGFSIKNARVRYDKEPSEIAELLQVESVLIGAMQLQGSTLKVTYLIARGDDNVTIGSGEVQGDLDEIFSLQERLATAVRDELAGSSTPQLITHYEPDSDAYDSYIRGLYAFEHRGDKDNLENAMALFQDSIRMDEYYGPAYLSLATAYALLPVYRNAPVDETNRLAIETVEMGVALDGSIADAAGAVYGSVYHKEKKWAESEAAYQRAVSAAVVDANAFNWYSRMLASVGRLDDSLTQALVAAAMDPDNAVINSRVAIAYTWLGDSEQAHEYFKRSNELGATGSTHLLAYALLLLRDGEYERARSLAAEGSRMAEVSAAWVDPVFAAFADRAPANIEAALVALEQASDAAELAPTVEIVARTMLGDIDRAIAVARRLEGPGEVFEMDLLYTPELAPLRNHQEFLPLLERLGIVDYWKAAGCTFDGWQASCRSD